MAKKKSGAAKRNLSEHGQAAMEYLMTYGWAILIIVIVLGSLLYLGVFSPKTPDICQFDVGFLCTSFRATTMPSGAMSIKISNALAETVFLCNMVCDAAMTSPPTIGECASGNWETVLRTGESALVNFEDSTPCLDEAGGVIPVGTRYQGKVYMLYSMRGDSGNARVSVGEIGTTIQP